MRHLDIRLEQQKDIDRAGGEVEAQLRAAEIANEGITLEYDSGSSRTTLEVIQSNSLLLNAQISLADSEKNYILSQFNLLKSIGLLNSKYLKID